MRVVVGELYDLRNAVHQYRNAGPLNCIALCTYVRIYVCYTCGVSELCTEFGICMITEAYIHYFIPSPPPPPPDPYSHEWSDYFQVHFVDIRRKEWDDLLFYVVRENKVHTYVLHVCTYVRTYKVATSNTYIKCYSMFACWGYFNEATFSVCHV